MCFLSFGMAFRWLIHDARLLDVDDDDVSPTGILFPSSAWRLLGWFG